MFEGEYFYGVTSSATLNCNKRTIFIEPRERKATGGHICSNDNIRTVELLACIRNCTATGWTVGKQNVYFGGQSFE